MFQKNGDVAVVADIFCSCGGKINKETKKCAKCNKTFIVQEVEEEIDGQN